MISEITKQDIYFACSRTIREWYGDDLPSQGACLYWSQAVMRELAMRGMRPVLQAGDLMWRVVPIVEDDGICNTHFGYEFDLSQQFSIDALQQGLLPEVHVWVALPHEGCLVDFTTGYLKELAQNRHGIAWRTENPPAYVFGDAPENATYRPKLEAIRFVWRFIAEKLAPPETRDRILELVG